jgi:hypothetical protein
MKTNITFIKSLTFFIALFCAVNFGFGQSIFTNPITGTNPHTNNPYTSGETTNPNITVSGIGRGAGITGDNANDRYSAQNWSIPFDNTDYFYFTITPNAGYEINFVSFVYTGQRSNGTGPTNFAFRSSLDLYTAPIGTPTDSGTTINLSSATYQNISGAITFRFYAWGANNGNGTFSINDFTFNGVVSPLGSCASVTIWDGTNWLPSSPDLTTVAIIDNDYDTSIGGSQISFSACSLIVSSGATLNIADNTFVEVQNDITVDPGSTFLVQTQGAVVQLDDLGIVTNNGTMRVIKTTSLLNAWYEYTYWSSPVLNPTIGSALFQSDASRRYWFDASQFEDSFYENANDGTLIAGAGIDDIDDNNNDWQWINGATVMTPGVGYAATHSEAFFIGPPMSSPPFQFDYFFDGLFNNGNRPVVVVRNDGSLLDMNWNLIGNPYPSAIDIDAFFDQNVYDLTLNPTGTIDRVAYLWSQNTPPSSTANGNQVLNFAASDYAVINLIGEAKGGDDDTNGDGVIDAEDDVKRFIPSGQAFFTTFSETRPTNTGTVIFNNAMRVKGATDNSQFFKNTNTKEKSSASNSLNNKLWINLTSDNGIFNQILVGYANGATNEDDGLSYDATKNLATGTAAILYSTIEDSNKKFAIQGKATSSLNEDEIINLGFKTTITIPTLYKLSVAQLEGAYLTSNAIFLVDTLLNKVHDLSASDYTFTSAVGEFNSRFSITFTNKALSVTDALLNTNALKIVELQDDFVQFNTSSNLTIKSVNIYDLLGRQLYQFKGENTSETYRLSHLNNSVYIAKVALSNGAVVTKKAVKK